MMLIRHRRSHVRRFLAILFIGSFTFCLWLNGGLPPNQKAIAQTPNATQLVQQGLDRYRTGDIQGSISTWQAALSAYRSSNDRAGRAIVEEKLAIAYQQIGQQGDAINFWKSAITSYRQQGEFVKVGRLLTEQAQTYSRLGQNKNAISLLCGASQTDDCPRSEGSALQIAQKFSDRQGEIAALGSLGEVYRLRGNYDRAIQTLETGLKAVQAMNAPIYQASMLNSLGNAFVSRAQLNEQRAASAQLRGAETKANEFNNTAKTDYKNALSYFNTSLDRAQNDQASRMRSLLNLLGLYSRSSTSKMLINSTEVEKSLQEALALLQQLPNSSSRVYAAIDLAELQQQIASGNSTFSAAQCSSQRVNDAQAETLLNQAITIAQTIQDSRAASFALGYLGHIYECRQTYDQALKITQQARLAANQKLLAKDSLYLWEWQAGRIFKVQGKESEANQAYERAIATLEGEGGIRDNLLIANRDLQFDFRNTISPLYREFAKLKLDRAESLGVANQAYQQELDSALDTVDSLKLAELQNYFGNECVLTVFDPERVDDLEREDTAFFSSIILEDRTAIVASLPNPDYKRKPNAAKRVKKLVWINDSQKLRETIKSFRLEIQRFYDPTDAYLPPAQELYNGIIRPFASDLEAAKIKTVVFIQDGLLRSVPMAALHDGQNFLVQRYAIATTPGLRLTAPQRLNLQGSRTLALGLSEAAIVDGEKFPALENVTDELNQAIEQTTGSKKLINEQFTRRSLEQELKQATYPIIHIATHGQFGTIPEDSFLVAGNREKITITDLESNIRRFSQGTEPVELLALTACQTGIGDDRATLGIAGITVQAGVRSALASLWYIDDTFTEELVAKFYNNLRSGQVSKAEALQAAQRDLISQNKQIHPAQWAPFTLIGNWL